LHQILDVLRPGGEFSQAAVQRRAMAVTQDIQVDGKMRKCLVHFDRNGCAYALGRRGAAGAVDAASFVNT
jgi:glucose dehydrogenase